MLGTTAPAAGTRNIALLRNTNPTAAVTLELHIHGPFRGAAPTGPPVRLQCYTTDPSEPALQPSHTTVTVPPGAAVACTFEAAAATFPPYETGSLSGERSDTNPVQSGQPLRVSAVDTHGQPLAEVKVEVQQQLPGGLSTSSSSSSSHGDNDDGVHKLGVDAGGGIVRRGCLIHQAGSLAMLSGFEVSSC